MTDNNDDGIGKKLGVTPMNSPLDQQSSNAVSTILDSAVNDSVSEDFEYSRGNIRNLIDEGNDAIFKLSQIAEQSQNPRAYEVLSDLINTMLKANQDLMELQKKAKELNKKTGDTTYVDKRTQSIFVGSTAELAKIVNKKED